MVIIRCAREVRTHEQRLGSSYGDVEKTTDERDKRSDVSVKSTSGHGHFEGEEEDEPFLLEFRSSRRARVRDSSIVDWIRKG